MTEENDVRPGRLLVATPELRDPNFVDTVVLVIEANDDGALGVVLNRPSPVPVAEVLHPWAPSVADPDVLFEGGPVGKDAAIAVALLVDSDDPPLGFRAVVGRLGLLDLDTPVELVDGTLSRLRIFAGYAGWGAAQLEGEVEEGSWYVVDGEPYDAFLDDVSTMWGAVLRRQPGELAFHATRPADPELN
ncbi:putative transcriptional regulator [Nocardioides albertanoniae]|uniref:Putative transcriptional regulator n=1 Tax=Nocardioides albertanoniae TaxID=1175486 RepID=A0A543AAV6_9ACTN|nr:YqgE/AlgH family protein [Nocardioides albertanoniae]TQL69650.1 putative transcriptional regulator [Nocardioides albertanoniae]